MSNAMLLFSAAELAYASYGKLEAAPTNSPLNIDVLTDPLGTVTMPATEAAELAKRYPTVVASYDDLPGTGFQATVFSDRVGNLTLAIRDTETSGGDFFPTDADILSFGAAYDQIVAMVNWWKRASGDPGTEVEQFRLVEVPDTQIPAGAVVLYPGASMDTSYVLDVAESKAVFTVAEGNISAALAADPDHRVEVAGHSTGGHLAMAFSTIFASDATGATVFNAPGFSDNATNQQFFQKLGGWIPAERAASVTTLPCAAGERVKGRGRHFGRIHSLQG